MTYLISEENDTAVRLDKWLTTQPNDLSRSHIIQLIDQSHITVNGKTVKSSYLTRMTDKIELILPETQPTKLVAVDIPIPIQYQDDDLLVVNKPSGLVVHPSAGHEQDTLVNGLLFHVKNLSMKNEERPGIVHRIDKETSGLLVVAKNDRAHEKLSEQFKNKTTHRVYYAVVTGMLKKEKGTIQSYLIRNPSDRKKYSSLRENGRIVTEFTEVIDHAKWAVTHYEIVKRLPHLTLVKLQLETGRTHQIRIHMSEAGHPVVGDVTYGYPNQLLKNKGLTRFYLHAAELGFVHPRTNEEMKFLAPWPPEDEAMLKSWGF
ncbi:MAG: RluA family pseudouridine synthase [Moraxellaceae bacterium]|nr:RluA family pseudouridine synthase [Pseudobdellovibrionaceae bacterium]